MSNDSTTDTTPDLGAIPTEVIAPRPADVDVGARTHCGKVRDNNEDNFHVIRFGRYLQTVFSSLTVDQFPEEADRHGGGDGLRLAAHPGLHERHRAPEELERHPPHLGGVVERVHARVAG